MAFLPPYTPRHLARSFLQTLTMAAPRRIPCMLLAAAAAFLLLAVADARTLSQDAAGTVEVVTDEVYTDINGGVPPLADRITAAQELLAPRLALIEVEAECREQGDLKCQKLVDLKKKQAEEKKFADAEENGEEQTVTVVKDGVEQEVTVVIARNDKPKTIEAPCRTNVFLNYWLGTLCLPETPFDVKPEEEDEAEAGRRRRKFLFF